MNTNVEYYPGVNKLKNDQINGAKTLNELRLMVKESDAKMAALVNAILSARTAEHTAAAEMRGNKQDPMAAETSGPEVYVLMNPAAAEDTKTDKDNAEMKPATTPASEMGGLLKHDEGDEEKKPAAKAKATTSAASGTTAVNDPGNTF